MREFEHCATIINAFKHGKMSICNEQSAWRIENEQNFPLRQQPLDVTLNMQVRLHNSIRISFHNVFYNSILIAYKYNKFILKHKYRGEISLRGENKYNVDTDTRIHMWTYYCDNVYMQIHQLNSAWAHRYHMCLAQVQEPSAWAQRYHMCLAQVQEPSAWAHRYHMCLTQVQELSAWA